MTPLSPGLVRPAHWGDATALLQLELLFPGDRLSSRSIRRFLSCPSRTPVWVAELDGKVVGNLIALTRRGSRGARIYSLAVAPEARRRRYAERLIAEAESWAVARGLERISLEVRQENEAARRLYLKLGFVEARALAGFYEDGGDGVKLIKLLSRRPAARDRC